MAKMTYSAEMKALIDEFIKRKSRDWIWMQILYLIAYGVCIFAYMESGRELPATAFVIGQIVVLWLILHANHSRKMYNNGHFPTHDSQVISLRKFAMKKEVSMKWFDDEISRMLKEYANNWIDK